MAHQLVSGVSKTQKLVGVSNYNVSQFKIKNILHKDDLWELVENDAIASVQTDPEGGLVVQANQATTADLVRHKKRALSIINLSKGDALVAHITNVTKSTMCWKILCDLFENNTTRKILLKNNLNSFHFEEDGSVSDYLNQIQGVLNQLTSIGVIVADSELITQILSTLPNSWEVLVSNLMYIIIMHVSLN